MQLIGELLNSSRKKAKEVLERRDEDALLTIASAQIVGGASWIDINAALLMREELETLLWAGNTIIDRLDVGVAIDSPDPDILVRCAEAFGSRCLLNSIDADERVLGSVLNAAARNGSGVIVMLKDSAGIAADSDGRLALAEIAVRAATSEGIDPERLYLDPVLQPLATGTDLAIVCAVLDALAAKYPAHQRVGGLSNVSFGLPQRRLVNRACAAVVVSRRITALICDPTDHGLIDILVASESLAGLDPGCRNLLRRFRTRGGR